MEQREAFVMSYIAKKASTAELCRRFGISRKTGYKWIQRFLDGGMPGLLDRSRAPLSHPHSVDDAAVDAILTLKKTHPTWGAKKLQARLCLLEPSVAWPSESTFARILKRHGLTQTRHPRRRTPVAEHRLAAAHNPNDVWCTDFKGKFRVARKYTHPLTITDAFSRFVLCCHDTGGESTEPTREAFERTFKEHGLPLRIRSDNGTPFASSSLGGLSRLSIWWIKLGILPERTRPAHPQDNGSHERMHRTLKAETAKPPRATQTLQQKAFDDWRRTFNEERPHEALKMATPASVYESSERRMPDELPDPEYPDHFEIHRVNKNGRLKRRGGYAHLSKLLQHELIGIEPIAEGVEHIWFGPIFLGQLAEHARRNLILTPNKPYKQKPQPEAPLLEELSPMS